MTNNDVLRRIRYILDLSDDQMMSIFELGELVVNRSLLSGWLKKDDDPGFQTCKGSELDSFLNGLITSKRGAREGDKPKPLKSLTNNIIFKKCKIAFDLKAEDIVDVLELADLRLSKHELSAFFRKAEHKNYRECKDQILRKFLSGLQLKLRTPSA